MKYGRQGACNLLTELATRCKGGQGANKSGQGANKAGQGASKVGQRSLARTLDMCRPKDEKARAPCTG